MTRAPTPIESFGPELMAALLAGSKERYSVQLPYTQAVKFRQRIYQLRTAMRAANHEAAASVAKTRVQITWPEDTEVKRSSRHVTWPKDPKTICTVVISPYDSEFTDALKQAGVKPAEIVDDPIDALAAPTPDALKGFEPS